MRNKRWCWAAAVLGALAVWSGCSSKTVPTQLAPYEEKLNELTPEERAALERRMELERQRGDMLPPLGVPPPAEGAD